MANTHNRPKRKTLTQLYDEVVESRRQLVMLFKSTLPTQPEEVTSPRLPERLGSPFIEVTCESSGLRHIIRKNSIVRWCPSQEGGTRVFHGAHSMVISHSFEDFTHLMGF